MCEYKTSRDLATNGPMRKTWKKKVMKRCVAICGGREAVTDIVRGGGVKLTPPPQLR